MKCIWHAGYCRNSRTGLQHQQNTKTVYYYCNDKCCFSPQHHFLLFHSITRSFLSFFRIFVIRSFLRFVKKFWSCIVCHCSFLQIFNHKLSGQFITHQDHVGLKGVLRISTTYFSSCNRCIFASMLRCTSQAHPCACVAKYIRKFQVPLTPLTRLVSE